MACFLLDTIALFSSLAQPLSLDTLDHLPMGGITHNGSWKSTAYWFALPDLFKLRSQITLDH